MDYTLRKVFEKIPQMIDVIYLIDSSSDTYTTLKDNALFHSVFGNSGSYSKMLQTHFLFMVEDIHESHIRLMNDLKKYENLANNDSLTGLFNRGRIDSEINSCIERCHSENKPVSLIMFDIDHFKHVNDTYDHAVGDYVIKAVSSIASKHLITHGGKLGRWGGEEFIGVFENITGDRIAEIAEELRVMISEYSFETVGNITSSFGVLEVNADESPSAVFQRIDSALYQAKNAGRNKVMRG